MPKVPTSMEIASFVRHTGDDDLLEKALDWISYNLNPEDVFEHDDLVEWAKENDFVRVDEIETE